MDMDYDLDNSMAFNKTEFDFDFDFKSPSNAPQTPTTPTTPTIHSTFTPGLHDYDNYSDFHLNPPKKSLSIQSISSNKENKHLSSNKHTRTPHTPIAKKKRGRGRPKGSKNKKKSICKKSISKTKNNRKNKNKNKNKNNSKLQLPNLKRIPKTVTQFELALSPYNTPSLTPIPKAKSIPFIHNTYTSYTPIPHFPDIDLPLDWDEDLHFNTSPIPFTDYSYHNYNPYYYNQSPVPISIEQYNNYNNNLPPQIQPQPQPHTQPDYISDFGQNTNRYYNMNSNNNEQYNNANHPNKRRKITHTNEEGNLYGRPYGESTFYGNNNSNVPGSIQQYQSENNNMNRSEIRSNSNNHNHNMSMSSVTGSENEPIISPNKRHNPVNNNVIMEEEEKNNNNNNSNITKRALFKEKLSNININANERSMHITPDTAPNDVNITSNLPNINAAQKPNMNERTQNNINNNINNNNNNLDLVNNDTMIMGADTAPILSNNNANNNANLDWFGTDENINTLNGNNHPFEMNMFPMGMGDEMKDMGLPSFMMNDIIPNNDMMDIDLMNNNAPINHRVKQENPTNILPPPINNNYSNTNYHNNLPRFSISSSPPQQPNMFMDQINTNTNNIYTPNDYTYGSNSNNIIRSRSLQSGPNTLRPSNLPTLRRAQSVTSSHSNSNNNNNNLGVEYVTKSASKSTDNSRNSKPNMNNNNNNNNPTTHVLTPFDYPLSNPTITSSAGIAHGTHSYYSQYITHNNGNIKQEKPIHSAPLYSISSVHNQNSNSSLNSRHSNSLSATPNPNTNYNFSLTSSLLSIPQHLTQNQHPSNPSFPPQIQYNDGFNHTNNANTHFNFLWWYPEVKFCELDPQLVPLP